MLKDFVYVTDNNKKYFVRLDAAIGDVTSLGFDTPTAVDNDLDFLPKFLRMRTISCTPDKNSLARSQRGRTFAVGNPSASILTNWGSFSYKGNGYVPRRFKPEKRKKQQTRG